MDDTKYYIWIATTVVVFTVFLATGHWFLALVALAVSYFFWNITS